MILPFSMVKFQLETLNADAGFIFLGPWNTKNPKPIFTAFPRRICYVLIAYRYYVTLFLWR